MAPTLGICISVIVLTIAALLACYVSVPIGFVIFAGYTMGIFAIYVTALLNGSELEQPREHDE